MNLVRETSESHILSTAQIHQRHSGNWRKRDATYATRQSLHPRRVRMLGTSRLTTPHEVRAGGASLMAKKEVLESRLLSSHFRVRELEAQKAALEDEVSQLERDLTSDASDREILVAEKHALLERCNASSGHYSACLQTLHHNFDLPANFSLKRCHEVIQGRFFEMEQEVERVSSANAELQSSIMRDDAKSKEVERVLRSKAKTKTAEAARKTLENSRLLQQVRDMGIEIEQKATQVVDASSEVAQLRQSLLAAEAKLVEQTDTFEKCSRQETAKAAVLTSNNAKLERSLLATEATNVAVVSENRRLEDQVAHFKAQVSRLKREQMTASQNLQSMQRFQEAVLEDLKKAEEDNEQLRATNDEFARECKNLLDEPIIKAYIEGAASANDYSGIIRLKDATREAENYVKTEDC